ncbi:hypothetical protein B9Z55_027296 [Caenorhabditis nigoni]|uniref:Uncharacterized protein n=1 Tax=Caenorhabditis nigoni TaxID=1611254 RepID=A0A2G5SH47_9PELO|nr:hypothetical protein B9Z55_027296 [Caenorhabditis nigoni]
MQQGPTKTWSPDAEDGLVELATQSPALCKVQYRHDIKELEMVMTSFLNFQRSQKKFQMDFQRVQESLNANLNKCFTVDAIIAKWLEFVQLFRLKYAINGYSMADRENTYNKDGTVKDDNRESWRFFNRLECLIDPTDGLGPKKKVKQEIIED